MRTSILAALLFTSLATSQETFALEPCCSVVSVNTRAGIVSVQENATRRRFDVKVDNPVMLGRIRAGQKVNADFAAGKASIEGASGSFAIVGAAPKVAA